MPHGRAEVSPTFRRDVPSGVEVPSTCSMVAAFVRTSPPSTSLKKSSRAGPSSASDAGAFFGRNLATAACFLNFTRRYFARRPSMTRLLIDSRCGCSKYRQYVRMSLRSPCSVQSPCRRVREPTTESRMRGSLATSRITSVVIDVGGALGVVFVRYCGGKFGVRFGVRFGVKLVTEGGVCCGTVDAKSVMRRAPACSVQPRESPTQRFILSRASAPTSGRASRFFLSARDIRQLASRRVVTVRRHCRRRRIVAVPAWRVVQSAER